MKRLQHWTVLLVKLLPFGLLVATVYGAVCVLAAL